MMAALFCRRNYSNRADFNDRVMVNTNRPSVNSSHRNRRFPDGSNCSDPSRISGSRHKQSRAFRIGLIEGYRTSEVISVRYLLSFGFLSTTTLIEICVSYFTVFLCSLDPTWLSLNPRSSGQTSDSWDQRANQLAIGIGVCLCVDLDVYVRVVVVSWGDFKILLRPILFFRGFWPKFSLLIISHL